MNEHDDIERVLSRYRPAAPPPSVRGRLVADVPQRSLSPLPWLAVAAALVIAMALSVQASRTFDALTSPTTDRAAKQRSAAIDDMTAALGGGELARRAAEQWFEASIALTATAATPRPSLEELWNQ